MRAVKSVSIDSARRVIITYLDGSTETLYPNCIWCDSEALRELIKDLLEEKADAITQTIENVTVASFADGADEGLIKKLLVSIEPIQEGSGDPSPENVRPISGRTGLSVARTGINVWDEETEYGYYSADNGQKASNISTQLCSKNYISVKPGTSYVFKKSNKLGDILFYDANKSYISGLINAGPNHVFMTPENCYYIRLNLGSTYGNTYNHDISINYPATDTDYYPYSGNTYSVNWETEAGTVYGGTLDVTKGELVVDHALYAVNDKTIIARQTGKTDYYFNVVIGGILSGSEINTGIISNILKSTPFGSASGIWNGNEGCCLREGGFTFFTDATKNMDANAAKQWLINNEAEIYYPVATLITYQLTPQEVRTLLGGNNIWADSGNILELEYTADTKLYISEQQSGTSGALGSGRQEIVNPDIQTVSEKTLEDVEAYKEDTDERGEK